MHRTFTTATLSKPTHTEHLPQQHSQNRNAQNEQKHNVEHNIFSTTQQHIERKDKGQTILPNNFRTTPERGDRKSETEGAYKQQYMKDDEDKWISNAITQTPTATITTT